MAPKNKSEWTVHLAEALKEWGPKNGYRYLSKLAEDLDIPSIVWKGISAGHAVANDSEIYAKLYLRTGLPEADPRTIPPRKRVVPRTGAMNAEQRAWSNDQWLEWLARQGENNSQTAKAASAESHSTESSGRPKADIRPPKPKRVASPPTGVTAGSMMDDFIKAIGRQVGEEAARVVKQELSSHHPAGNGLSLATVEELAAALIERLTPFKNKSSAELERAIGKRTLVDKIGELLHLLQLLTMPDTEKAISHRLERDWNA